MARLRKRDESVPEAMALAAVGGFLDAYAFLSLGGVFANAQTGNVVLFGIGAGTGQWGEALRHLPPLAAFVVGMITVEALARMRHVRWLARPARVVLVTECVVFTIVGLATPPRTVAVVLVAWAATLQVGTFRQVRSSSYNTTFTTGNLRSLVSESAGWLVDRDAGAGGRARALLAVVLSFAGGAVLGALAVRVLHDHAVLLTVPVLLIVLVVIVAGTTRRAGPAPGAA